MFIERGGRRVFGGTSPYTAYSSRASLNTKALEYLATISVDSVIFETDCDCKFMVIKKVNADKKDVS